MTSRLRRPRVAVAGLAFLAIASATALQQLPATAETSAPGRTSLADPDSFVTLGDSNIVPGLEDVTSSLTSTGKVDKVLPSTTQLSAAEALPAGSNVQWNDLGTPASIFTPTGVLMPRRAGESAEETASRWIAANTRILGISEAQVADFEIVSDQPFAGSDAKAVLFRQKFGDLTAATRSLITVGVSASGDVAYVSSSLVKAQGAPEQAATLTPQAAWLAAADLAGRAGVSSGAMKLLSGPTTAVAAANGAWTKFSVTGFAQTQQIRLRAFAKPDGTVRPAYEATVLNNIGGNAIAYRVIVDGVDGSLLFRQNAVENSNDAFPFQGTYPGNGCGDRQDFTITDDNTKSIVLTATAVVAVDDIRIKLFFGDAQLGDFDLGTSPETGVYSNPFIRGGVYSIQVCSFDANQIGGPYAATVTTSDTTVAGGTGAASTPNPRWRAFAANPTLAATQVDNVPTNTVIECWFFGTADCSAKETHQNVAAFGPWDTLAGLPTFTTVGNNANTHEAWASFLTPGGAEQAPFSLTRDYTDEFTDVWNESGCGLTNFTPGGNDILPVTTNLFTGHNRIHDYSYYLGFTEKNFNLQTDNQGRGGTGGDAEVGNVQAGAADGGAAGMYMGRDNANQIALMDGVPGITNQYLFQPIAAAFYSPCTDGALDTGIYGHEYTHAISNRMVAGPDDGLTGAQGGSMGESWSDLNASEYQFENDYLSDPTVAKNPWSLGSYTTGNFDKGIRDYALNDNPLNYGDFGFDTTGAEVHADGEIWNGTQWEVRQALVNKWDAQFDYSDKALQERCEQATATTTPLDASACPGNRRWIQMIFDSFLLQANGATDMLQARNAMMAADQMRYPVAQQNQLTLAQAFARRGMGADAVTSVPADGGEDITIPSFRSAQGNNSAVTFASTGAGNLYVGDYEARSTPVADTDPATALPATASFTPGIYKLTYVSATQGFRRFAITVPDNGAAYTTTVPDAATNLAAIPSGGVVIAGASSADADSLNPEALFDGTEASNWGGSAGAVNIDDATTHPSVAVDLAGGVQTITSANVSAMLHPAPADDPTGLGIDIPVFGAEDDPLSGSRFTALRKFALQACTAGCDDPANYATFFTSPDNAFDATIPRPVAPDQLLRTFTFAPVQAAAVRLVALENQCTGQDLYAGEQDNDDSNSTDCKTQSERGQVVHVAELQVFGSNVSATPISAPAGDGTPGSGTAGQGTSALPTAGQVTLPSTSGLALVPTTGNVAKLLKTRTRIRLPRVQQVKGRESTKMKYSVVGIGGTSLGKVAGKAVVKLDGKKVKKKAVVVTLKQGKKVVGYTFRVPKSLGFGKHYLQVFFKTGNTTLYTASKSRRILLTVVGSRPRG